MRTSRIILNGGAAIALFAMVACEPYRIEHRRRPDWHARMVEGPQPDRRVLEDGTIILYNQRDSSRAFVGEAKPEGFQLRRENTDGSISLFARIPEHVVVNALHCVREGEYQLLWDQLVSEQAKLIMAEQGEGYEDFKRFITDPKNRVEVGRTLTRMSIGISMQDASVVTIGPGHYRIQFWPHIIKAPKDRGGFKFNYVEVVREGVALKLHAIY